MTRRFLQHWHPVLHSFRPINALEQREGSDVVVDFSENLATVHLRSAALSSGAEKDGFTFDRVFPMQTKQQEVFDYGVKEWVELLLTRLYDSCGRYSIVKGEVVSLVERIWIARLRLYASWHAY
jgi:hypothetical protein